MYLVIAAAVLILIAVVVELGFGAIDPFWKKLLAVIIAVLLIFGILQLAGMLPFRFA